MILVFQMAMCENFKPNAWFKKYYFKTTKFWYLFCFVYRKKLSKMQETLTLLLCCLGFALSFDLYFGCHWDIASVNTMEAFKSLKKVSLDFKEPVDVTELLTDMTIYDFHICKKVSLLKLEAK